jgi:hypothetical protein
MDNRTIEEVRRNEDKLIKEKENLEAQLELYIGTLKREHEAIKMLNELEEENAKLLKQNEFLMKDSNTLQNLEMYLENMWNDTQDVWVIKIINKIKEFKGEK